MTAILTGILTLSSPPLSSLPGPHHHVHCWSSCSRVIRPRYPHLYPPCNPHPPSPHLQCWSARCRVMQSPPILTRTSPPSYQQCWSSRSRVIRYPHRHPRRYPQPPGPHHQCWSSCHPSPPLSSPPSPQHLHLKPVTEGRLSEPGSLRRGRGCSDCEGPGHCSEAGGLQGIWGLQRL